MYNSDDGDCGCGGSKSGGSTNNEKGGQSGGSSKNQ